MNPAACDYEGVQPPVATTRAAPPRLQKNLLIQYVLCCVLLPPTFYVGHPSIGGYAFSLGLLALLTYHAFLRRPLHVLCLLIGAVPLIDLLRGTFMPFNTPVILLTGAYVWISFMPGMFESYWKRKDMRCIIAVCILYWIISFALTGDYARNIRTIEWALTASSVFMLSERRSFLSTAFMGIGISSIVMAVTLIPFGDRLGMSGKVEGLDWGIGNPIVLGVPTAFFLLLCIAERGKWVLLENRPVWRMVLSGLSGIILLLSTSRGSWVILLVGLLIIAIVDTRARAHILYSIVAFTLLLMGIMSLHLSRFENVAHYVDKTFSPDTSIEKRTTGRIDQWRALPQILKDSPVWGVGPGGGRAASVAYAGKNIIFHSLYLQIAAETALLGFPLLAILLIRALRRCLTHFALYGELAPLLGIVSFMLMGMSVAGLDIVGGTLLGLGLVGGNTKNLWFVKQEGRQVMISSSEAGFTTAAVEIS